jgi:serine/threonine-protein kinase
MIMADDDLLNKLVLQWEEAQEAGQGISPESLCQDWPQLREPLRRRIRALLALDVLLQLPDQVDRIADEGQSAAHRSGAVATHCCFQLLREHARGGLGEIVVANDQQLGREVALKFIQNSRADSRASRGRFLREAETTGVLEHPGIVPVYGLGEDERGRPFYVMRFIRGETLADTIQRLHKTANDFPTDLQVRVELRQLLSRFVAVCNTIAYAHSRGFVHRDIKPANILLGPYGETLVADWGLAKPAWGSPINKTARDDSQMAEPAHKDCSAELRTGEATDVQVGSEYEVTVAGHVVGTPAYMSPEQAAGLPDSATPASDVYSLGATLHAILHGFAIHAITLPASGRILRKHRATNPAALTAIANRAMATLPQDRYPSALDLAHDVEQWMADEPVSVFRESAMERIGRWTRRHRTIAVSGGLTVVLLALFLAVLAAMLNVKNLQLAKALSAETTSKEHARQVLDAQTSLVLEDLLGRQQTLTAKHKEFLQDAAQAYEAFAAELGDDHETRFRLVQARQRAAAIYQRLGEYKRAEQAMESCLAELDKTNVTPANRIRWLETRHSIYNDVGGLHLNSKDLSRAEAALENARQIGNDLSGELGQGVDRDSQATTLMRLALVYDNGDRLQKAEETYRLAVDAWKNIAERHPNALAAHLNCAANFNNLGTLLARQGRMQDAWAAFRDAVELRQQLVSQDPQNPRLQDELAGTHNNLGLLSSKIGRLADAERYLRAAHANWEQLTQEFPTVADYSLHLGSSSANLGFLAFNCGRSAEALPWLDQAIVVTEALVRRLPEDLRCRYLLRDAHWGRGSVLDEMDRRSEADASWIRALALDNGPMQLNSGILRAESHLRNGSFSQALAAADAFAATAPTEGEVLYRLGRIYSLLAKVTAGDLRRDEHIAAAIRCLQKGAPTGFLAIPGILHRLRSDSCFEPLRSQDRFTALLVELESVPR